MKIGIIGAPGSGKSKFAEDLGEAFDFTTVDNYVQRLKDTTDLELGYWASYSENFMIAGVRMAEERQFKDTITAGTILDTLLYCAMKHDTTLTRGGQGAVQQAYKRSEYARVNSAMNAMGMMYTESWLYDLAFYLPFEKQASIEDTEWERIFDNEIPHLLEVFHAPVITLSGSHDDKVRLAKEVTEIVLAEENPIKTTSSE
jgi:hypothetical protein